MKIYPNDLRIDSYQAGIARSEFMRLTHMPTGIVITRDNLPEGKKNRIDAIKKLKEILKDGYLTTATPREAPQGALNEGAHAKRNSRAMAGPRSWTH